MKVYSNNEKREFGYSYEGMVMVDKELAYLLFVSGQENVYALTYEGSEVLIENESRFTDFDDMYGIEIGI